MRLIRKKHKKTKEELKDLLIQLINENGLESSIQWNGFAFAAKSYGTSIKGEIFDTEVHVEITGLFEKQAEQKLREGWKHLVISSRV
jgi:hypothetical protein